MATQSNIITPPTPDLVTRWNKGDPITDEELDHIEKFFAALMAGIDALGPRYGLAWEALQREHHRATGYQFARESTVRMQDWAERQLQRDQQEA